MTTAAAAAVSSSSSLLANPYAGIFPVMSYLHVPGKMSTPLWLMMGTAFLIEAPTEALRRRAPHLLLTSAHTFQPWSYMTDPTKLKIPNEYRKPRYVIGRAFLYDAVGTVQGTDRFQLALSAVHPTLDIALLAMHGVDSDAFTTLAKQRSALHRWKLAEEDPAIGRSVTIAGFRGRGQLGELDTSDPHTLEKLSPADREALLLDMKAVEGKQEGCVAGLSVVRRGVALPTHRTCYNGMSGAPCVSSLPSTIQDSQNSNNKEEAVVVGALYGKLGFHDGLIQPPPPPRPLSEKDLIGYIPSSAIVEWLKTLS